MEYWQKHEQDSRKIFFTGFVVALSCFILHFIFPLGGIFLFAFVLVVPIILIVLWLRIVRVTCQKCYASVWNFKRYKVDEEAPEYREFPCARCGYTTKIRGQFQDDDSP